MSAARAAYLARQRWYAGTPQPVDRIEPGSWIREPTEGFGVRFERVVMADGTVYNVPASYRREPVETMSASLMAVEEVDGVLYRVYDALLDAHARTALLAGFFGRDTPGLEYTTVVDLAVDPAVTTVPLVAEQSNTSIVVGEALLAKFFRILVPGRNPDIELSRALSEAGSAHIAPVRGWISDGEADLAMLYDYYLSATDGWDSARTSFRDLLAGPSDDPALAGADFAPEARRLGATVRRVHSELASIGTVVWGPVELAALAVALRDRLERHAAGIAELSDHRAAAAEAFEELTRIDEPVPAQRVHGDLHLGQTLRTIDGWTLIDFEGEPGASLDARTRMDSPLRDVAGMLRSLDYAPHSVLMQTGQDDPESRRRAVAWARRNHEAFLDGYGVGADPTSWVLLRCYQIDKAVYEVGYESRHRPTWAQIPRAALDRLLP